MAGKKKGKGKKGKKGKKSKKKITIGNETPDVVVRRLWKHYDRKCQESGTFVSKDVKSAMLSAVENEDLFTKVVMRPIHDPPAVKAVESADGDPAPPVVQPPQIISLMPLLTAIRNEHYVFVREYHVWCIPVSYMEACCLAQMLEKYEYVMLRLELMNSLLSVDSVRRLATGVCVSHLSHLNLDFNEFGDEGCRVLCRGLDSCRRLVSLSLCYCCLGPGSGQMLAGLALTSSVSELYLDGNDLGCEGALKLIQAFATQAEIEAAQREEEERLKAEQEALEKEMAAAAIAAGEAPKEEEKPKKKKKKKKGKKKKGPPPPPPVGPWLRKIHLADNSIDHLQPGGGSACLQCIREFRRLVTFSLCLEEIDLEDNFIGDVGGRELLEALEDRKEVGLPNMKLRTTSRMTTSILTHIIRLGKGLKKKKRRAKKKKK